MCNNLVMTEIQKLISQTEMMLREEGISYSIRELIEMRRPSVIADLRAGEAYVCVKVPSRCEVSIPAAVARLYL